MRTMALAATAAFLVAMAGSALAEAGDDSHPIPLHMARGTDTVTVRGRLGPHSDCCNYTFKAHAGQTLYFTFNGPAARLGLTYPNGDGIDPGLPSPTPLPQDGEYTFSISPDLMAEGIYGRFTLKIRIPPH